jgi:hypothetical protein
VSLCLKNTTILLIKVGIWRSSVGIATAEVRFPVVAKYFSFIVMSIDPSIMQQLVHTLISHSGR